MDTCGAEEPYEGNLHVRFCGGIGRVIADPTRTSDGCQRPLLRRSRFRQQVSASVRVCRDKLARCEGCKSPTVQAEPATLAPSQARPSVTESVKR